MKEIIQRGAEAIIYKDKLEGRSVIVKERVKKGYRAEDLDENIRSKRTRHEARLMERAQTNGLSVPKILRKEKFALSMELIEGDKVKDVLNFADAKELKRICSEMGKLAIGIHDQGIIHGDLTTSNFIVRKDTGKVYLIDFGLGKFERKTEARAVDLHLLFEALKSTHFVVLENAWDNVLEAYKEGCDNWKEMETRIEQIKKRRRYK